MAAGYLFQGINLVIPLSVEINDALKGLDTSLMRQSGVSLESFGGAEYYTIPPLIAGDSPVSGCLLDPRANLPSGWRLVPIREALTVLADTPLDGSRKNLTERILRAYHVLQWRNDSLYCGSCGEKNGDSPDELARLCPRCGRIEYPRIAPAVIILITDNEDRILLAHNSKFKPNMYSLIAGFVEAGESLEAAALREIKEELNIEIQEPRYITSQSWPFPNSLMIGFTARYASGDLRPDGKEILDARWFTRESVLRGEVDIPSLGSVSRYIIDWWLDGKIG